uniref:Uncharacterized protein n=1 Tax=Plectus sambesii TaxID=2011161 RepID=A0A914W8W8_9BILA
MSAIVQPVVSVPVFVVFMTILLVREAKCTPIFWNDIVVDMGVPEFAEISRPSVRSIESGSRRLQALNDIIRRVVGAQNIQTLRPSEPFSNNDLTSWERLGWGWGKRR